MLDKPLYFVCVHPSKYCFTWWGKKKKKENMS